MYATGVQKLSVNIRFVDEQNIISDTGCYISCIVSQKIRCQVFFIVITINMDFLKFLLLVVVWHIILYTKVKLNKYFTNIQVIAVFTTISVIAFGNQNYLSFAST